MGWGAGGTVAPAEDNARQSRPLFGPEPLSQLRLRFLLFPGGAFQVVRCLRFLFRLWNCVRGQEKVRRRSGDRQDPFPFSWAEQN